MYKYLNKIVSIKKATLPKKIYMVLLPAWSLLLSLKTLIVLLVVLVLIDLFTGIRKNLYLKGEPYKMFSGNIIKSIESYSLRRTWNKLYSYLMGVICFVLIELLMTGRIDIPLNFQEKSLTLTEISIALPCLIELWSIFENLEAISGNNPLKLVMGLLPEGFKKIFKNKNDV